MGFWVIAPTSLCCELLGFKNTKEGGNHSCWGILDGFKEMASELGLAGWVDVQQAHDWITDGEELNFRLDKQI